MTPLLPLYVVFGLTAVAALLALIRSIRIIPAQTAVVVERLGKYCRTLEAGLHVLVPFIDRARYSHNLKEQAIDVPTQPCFTWDNVKVEVDGVLYFRVVDPKRASYGISDYRYATVQLAQTTMRSIIGKLELDKTFEEREQINAAIVRSIDAATDPWGVQITRYEIQNIRVPDNILGAMEIQLRADRERRAAIARSLGTMESKINSSVGAMEESINRSEGEKQRRVYEAEGRASEIRALSRASAGSLRRIANALEAEGGDEALALQISERFIRELSAMARPETRVVVPMDVTDIDSVLETVRRMIAKP